MEWGGWGWGWWSRAGEVEVGVLAPPSYAPTAVEGEVVRGPPPGELCAMLVSARRV